MIRFLTHVLFHFWVTPTIDKEPIFLTMQQKTLLFGGFLPDQFISPILRLPFLLHHRGVDLF